MSTTPTSPTAPLTLDEVPIESILDGTYTSEYGVPETARGVLAQRAIQTVTLKKGLDTQAAAAQKLINNLVAGINALDALDDDEA